jgi:hypothetical protein
LTSKTRYGWLNPTGRRVVISHGGKTLGYTRAGTRGKPTIWEDNTMRIQHRECSMLVAAMLVGLVGVTAVAAAGEQFLPVLSIREGALRSLL